MSANFFDIKSNWNILEPHLQNPEFIEAVNLYHWWSFKPENGIVLPFIETDRFDDYGINTNDVIFVKEKLTENYSTSNPYWFCQPCDCVELNTIITYKLFKLAYPEKEWYFATINLNSEQQSHIVITDKRIPNNTVLKYDPYLVSTTPDDNNIIFYDLIYPLMPWYGKIFSDRSDLTTINIPYSVPIADHWKGMNYISYFNRAK